MNPTATQLDAFIEPTKRPRSAAGTADVAQFLAAARASTLRPGVRRVGPRRLEYSWQRAQPARPRGLPGGVPGAVLQREAVQELAYEEFRLRGRREAGRAEDYGAAMGFQASWPDWPGRPDPIRPRLRRRARRRPPDVYSLVRAARVVLCMRDGPPTRFPQSWAAARRPLFAACFSSNQEAAEDLDPSRSAPAFEGTDFLGFILLATLGRGASPRPSFPGGAEGGACQPARCGEGHRIAAPRTPTLAQLQHTHITPIYSLHVGTPHQVVCMPYLGSPRWQTCLRSPQHWRGAPSRCVHITPAEAARPAWGTVPCARCCIGRQP